VRGRRADGADRQASGKEVSQWVRWVPAAPPVRPKGTRAPHTRHAAARCPREAAPGQRWTRRPPVQPWHVEQRGPHTGADTPGGRGAGGLLTGDGGTPNKVRGGAGAGKGGPPGVTGPEATGPGAMGAGRPSAGGCGTPNRGQGGAGAGKGETPGDTGGGGPTREQGGREGSGGAVAEGGTEPRRPEAPRPLGERAGVEGGGRGLDSDPRGVS